MKKAQYQAIAEKLSQDAEASASVSVYISPEEVAEALGDKTFDPDEGPYDALTKWIERRIMLGFEATTQDILDWMADR